ncbi:YciI family protein [Actinophytocola sp.]|uniref:YciI family protein n=1 Tax=Actinophytocola sp. TaxID=1872138 RepID=UPI002D7F3936|nr:YciI family protein [Actinophytocola sp.]HET9138043.1 YciI family protein [Actinophytocola sp.]HEU5110862.1 YciI family protein [Micromonosporaceae bacterium]
MYVVELSFDDNPDRLAHRPAHREKLREQREQGVVVMAGPWGDDTGALLIVDIDDAEELERLLEDDPYYRAPGVTIVSKRQWAPVIR